MKRHQRVDHRSHGDDREQAGGDAPDAVSEIEQAHGQTAQDDGEVQPGEKCALVGEEDFGFDPCGKRDAFAFFGWRVITLVCRAWVGSIRRTYLGRFGGEVDSTFLTWGADGRWGTGKEAKN